MLKNISKREKVLAGVTIGITLAALAYNVVIDPLVRLRNTIDNEIREKEVLLAKHSRILRDKELIKELNVKYSRYFHANKSTPDEESAEALSTIEKLGRNVNVHITNIKPMGYKKFSNFDKFTFRVSTESSIGELAKFIYGLQTSEQLLKVERMVLGAQERKPDTIKAILNITKISVF